MAELFRPTRLFDIQDRAEVLLPLKRNWGSAEYEEMPVEYRERLKRLVLTQALISGLKDG